MYRIHRCLRIHRIVSCLNPAWSLSEEGISSPSPLSSRLYRSAVGKRRLCHRPGKAMGLSRSKLENVLPQTDVWVLHASKVSLIHKTLTHVEVGTRCRRFLAPCSLAGRRASKYYYVTFVSKERARSCTTSTKRLQLPMSLIIIGAGMSATSTGNCHTSWLEMGMTPLTSEPCTRRERAVSSNHVSDACRGVS